MWCSHASMLVKCYKECDTRLALCFHFCSLWAGLLNEELIFHLRKPSTENYSNCIRQQIAMWYAIEFWKFLKCHSRNERPTGTSFWMSRRQPATSWSMHHQCNDLPWPVECWSNRPKQAGVNVSSLMALSFLQFWTCEQPLLRIFSHQ